MTENHTLRSFLRKEFEDRKSKNSRYSLRTFAKFLKMSPAHLSMILSGKRSLKAKTALHLGEVLGLTSMETLSLLQSKNPSRQTDAQDDIRILNIDEFGPIASWHYFAILGLAGLESNLADSRWIASKLGIAPSLAKTCFDDLVRLGYVEIKNGQFRQISKPLRTTDDTPAGAIRRHHKQKLQLAAQKIDQVDVSLREYNSMTLPMNPRKLATAKKMIRDFKEIFTKEITKGKKSEVYEFSIQLFPLTELARPEARK